MYREGFIVAVSRCEGRCPVAYVDALESSIRPMELTLTDVIEASTKRVQSTVARIKALSPDPS